MISAWIARQGQGDHVVKAYLDMRRGLTQDAVAGDPEWGLMLDQLLQYHYDGGNMGPLLVKLNQTISQLKEGNL